MGGHWILCYRLSLSRMRVVPRILLIACAALPIFPFMMAVQHRLPSTTPGLSLLALLAGTIFFVPAHEALHGLAFWLYARSVTFGFKPWTALGPVFFAASPGNIFTRRQYQLVCIAPQIMTVLLFFLAAVLYPTDLLFLSMTYAATLNLGGGVVDMFIYTILFRFPRDAMVEDSTDGMDVYLLGRTA